jgi:hypothetical protein
MNGDVIDIASRRHAATQPKSARFVATTEGQIALEITLEDGELVDVLMTPDQGAALVIQGTDAVEVAQEIGRGRG